jgi:3-hydroxyacyl-CoA dehydrogenase
MTAAYVAPFAERDLTYPARPLAALKHHLVLENAGAALCDIGDGIACLEYKTKMNIYDESVFDAIGAALEEVPKGFRALVIGSDHPRAFSCGADLAFFLGRMKAGDYATLEHFLAYGQERFLDFKYAPFPVIAAAFGLALGGGCETLLHVHEVVAHAELNAGLPESTLGILPGWGGCTQLVVRARQRADAPKGPIAALRDPFFQILGGRFSGSALQAQEAGFLRAADRIVMNRSEVIGHAKARAHELAEAGFTPPQPEALSLPGPSGKSSLMAEARGRAELGQLTANDLAVADALATVLSGGATDPSLPMTERQIMALEREATLSLARRPATFERIEHMLAKGRPLRN